MSAVWLRFGAGFRRRAVAVRRPRADGRHRGRGGADRGRGRAPHRDDVARRAGARGGSGRAACYEPNEAAEPPMTTPLLELAQPVTRERVAPGVVRGDRRARPRDGRARRVRRRRPVRRRPRRPQRGSAGRRRVGRSPAWRSRRTWREPLATWCALVGVVVAGALVGAGGYQDGGSASARVLRGFAVGAIPMVVTGLVVTLPDGRVLDRVRRVALAVFALTGVAFGATFAGRRGALRSGPIVVESSALGAHRASSRSSTGTAGRRRSSGPACSGPGGVWWSRRWVSAGVWLLRGLVGWPGVAVEVTVIGTAVVPVSIALGAVDRLAVRIDRLLAASIEAGGLMVMVGAVYVVVVLGFGDAPHDSERRVLGLSMVAAVVAALLYAPARARLHEFANRRVYGERRAPDEPLQTFGARMSRAIPLDELLLQLAESLKKSMHLAEAEVWTGTAGVLECAASVPYRAAANASGSTDEEVAIVARAHVSGNAWLQVWLPDLLAAHEGRVLRVAPMAHSGELLGLLVCARRPRRHAIHRRGGAGPHGARAAGRARVAQHPPRHRAAGVARRPARRERATPRVARPHRRRCRPVAAPHRTRPARRRPAAPRRARGEARARAPDPREGPGDRSPSCSKTSAPRRSRR